MHQLSYRKIGSTRVRERQWGKRLKRHIKARSWRSFQYFNKFVSKDLGSRNCGVRTLFCKQHGAFEQRHVTVKETAEKSPNRVTITCQDWKRDNKPMCQRGLQMNFRLKSERDKEKQTTKATSQLKKPSIFSIYPPRNPLIWEQLGTHCSCGPEFPTRRSKASQ